MFSANSPNHLSAIQTILGHFHALPQITQPRRRESSNRLQTRLCGKKKRRFSTEFSETVKSAYWFAACEKILKMDHLLRFFFTWAASGCRLSLLCTWPEKALQMQVDSPPHFTLKMSLMKVYTWCTSFLFGNFLKLIGTDKLACSVTSCCQISSSAPSEADCVVGLYGDGWFGYLVVCFFFWRERQEMKHDTH